MLLALDIGRHRTGAAFADASIGVPLALDTIKHDSSAQLIHAVRGMVREKKINRIVAGLPLLPSGEEGEQARFVHAIVAELETIGVPVSLLDERYTTPQTGEADGNAVAAVELLRLVLRRGP